MPMDATAPNDLPTASLCRPYVPGIAAMNTPEPRLGSVERAPTEDTSRSSRTQPAPNVGTPIYDALCQELAERQADGWPVDDPDPPTERALRIPAGWFTPSPDVEHTRSALTVTG